MFKVETYQDPHTYFSTLQLEEDALHITGDSSLRVYLNGSAPNPKWVLTMEEFKRKLFPQWDSPLAYPFLKAKLRKIIQQELESSDPSPTSLGYSLDRWVEAIRLLAELGITQLALPQAKEERTSEVELFVRVWRQLLLDVEARKFIFSRQRQAMQSPWVEAFGKKPQAIYVYQMIQLDASRLFLFAQCQLQGIPVIFRIPYISSLPRIYRPWFQMYEKLVRDDWPEDQQPMAIRRGQKWLAYQSQDDVIDLAEDEAAPQFYQFASPVHFQRYLEQNPIRLGERRILTSKSKELNRAFRQADPRSLSHLPSNRFLYYLYQCKKREGTIWLDYESFVECLTSGWINVKEVNGSKADTLLWDLEPYMKGARNLDEILNRVKQLKELQEVSHIFDQEVKEKAGRNRIKKYLSNPLRAFPYVHKSRHSVTLKQLETLIEHFKKVVLHLLPEEGEEMPVSHHFYLLGKLFQRVEKHLEYENEETKTKMREVFQYCLSDHWQASREELKDCMAILLGRSVDQNETKNDFDNLDQLEGLVLQTKDLHLTNLSLQSLQTYSPKVEIAPLTFPWLKQLGKSNFRANDYRGRLYLLAIYIHYQLNQMKSDYLRFQIFYLLAFSCGEVTFSWIQDLYPHDEKSSFLEVLFLLYGQQEEIPYWQEEREEVPFAPLPKEKTEPKIDGKPLQNNIPTLYWLDQDFCARKFFFNSLLELQPVYESDFHQRILFAILAKLFAQQSSDGEEEVFTYLFPLFPQWSETLKRNLYQTEYRSNSSDYRSFQNIFYPRAMERLQRLYSRYEVTKRWKVKHAYQHHRENEAIWLQDWLATVDESNVKAEPGQHCMMCPYLLICEKGEFAIDRNE